MHRISMLSLALVVALAAATVSARALETANGSTVAQLFDVADVADATQYPPGFAGVEWGDLATLHFGSRGTSHAEQSNDLASGGADVFVVVRGYDDELDRVYTGLVRHDGASLHHVLQDVNVRILPGPITSSTGDELRGVVVSPVTAGRLTAGHPVVTRHHKLIPSEVHLQLVSVDPGTGMETLVHSWSTAALNPEAIVAIDSGGDVFVLEAGLPEVGGSGDDGDTIRKLTWNPTAGSYDETRLGTTQYCGGLLVGPDDFVYGFDAADRWKIVVSPYPDRQILRIDPDSGARTTWARTDGRSFVFDWRWSSDARLYVGMRSSGRKAIGYVAAASPSATAGTSSRISSSADDPDSIAAAPDGALYVLERPFDPTGAVYVLTPGAGGSSGGGGGSGGGKGKKR